MLNLGKFNRMNLDEIKPFMSKQKKKITSKKAKPKRKVIRNKRVKKSTPLHDVWIDVHPVMRINGIAYHGRVKVSAPIAGVLRQMMQDYQRNKLKITDGTDHGMKEIAVL